MRLFQVIKRGFFAGALLMLAGSASAEVRTLIELNGDTPSPGLATSWKKVKSGEYQFTLDISKEIGRGIPVSTSAVKAALEDKLGASQGVKVKEQSVNVVNVTYTGDDAAFLSAVAGTKIRANQDSQIALESSKSESSIRANPGNRNAKAGEVKATVISTQPGLLVVRVNDSQAAAVKAGSKVRLKADSANYRPTKTIFFVPEKLEGDAWIPKAGSVQDH